MMSSNTINGQIYVGLSINRIHHGIHLVLCINSAPGQAGRWTMARCLAALGLLCPACLALRRGDDAGSHHGCRPRPSMAKGCAGHENLGTPRDETCHLAKLQKFCFSSVTQDFNDLRFSESRHSSLSIFAKLGVCEKASPCYSPTYWADMLAMMEAPRMSLCVPL